MSQKAAYQAQRYAFNLRLHVAALTNFEYLKLFVGGDRPELESPWDLYRQWHYTQYLDNANELWDLLARQNVADAILDKLVASLPKTTTRGKLHQGWRVVRSKGRTVDAEFLAYIEAEREKLATDLVQQNRRVKWSDELLTECVQRIINRVLFMRICEDRDIDTGPTLDAILNKWHGMPAGKAPLYSHLVAHFNSLDESFNGALFAKGHESEQLKVSDQYLGSLITELSRDDSPYLFSTLPVEILGSVYERFIGKVVHISKRKKVKVELKPELRKSGGVYYTPRFIVNSIVDKTVGRLIEGRSPQEISTVKIVDPACGSGSFLLRVFELICEHHVRWFQDNPRLQKPEHCYRDKQNTLRLTTHLKRQIMFNNVFGVDVDYQAVEVTMLSLYLKILEDETRATLATQHEQFPEETFLPDLSSNIKCGNSLIAPDFYEQLSLLESNGSPRVNTFDWSDTFPAVSAGGFDAVVGNPPYVRIQILKKIRPQETAYFKLRYATAKKGNYDVYSVFVEKGFSLLNTKGRLGYIVPSKFFATDYGRPLRKLLSDRQAVREVIDFRHEQVFEGPTTYTCLIFLSSEPSDTVLYSIASPPTRITTNGLRLQAMDSKELAAEPWTFGSREAAAIRKKLHKDSTPLLALPASMSRGTSTGADNVFIVRRTKRGFETRTGKSVKLEAGILRTPIYASDFGRYNFHPVAEEKIIFPYTVTEDGYSLLTERSLEADFPEAYKYLKSRKRELLKRKGFAKWYSFSAPRNLNTHDQADFLVPLLADKGLFCNLPKNKNAYCLMASGGFSISIGQESGCPAEYALGILNSKLMFWLLQSMSNVFRGGWITCTKQYVGKVPLKRVDVSDSVARERRDAVVKAVKQAVGLYDSYASAKTARQKTEAERQITAAEARIDALVYELYGLTKTEIALVESSLDVHGTGPTSGEPLKRPPVSESRMAAAKAQAL